MEAARKRVEERRARARRARGAAARRRRRVAAATLLCLACFFALCLLTAAFEAIGFRGDEAVRTVELPAANRDDLQALLAAAPQRVTPPQITARSSILVDPDSGQVLFEDNADEPLPNASTTKILTGIIALERCSLSERVLISKRAAATPEQSIWLQEGETLTVEQLLYALLLRSANDAAVALAEKVSGSVEAFSELMNERAAEMGATSSNFVTPSGLDAPGHRTTARDLAAIASYCMDNPEFRKIVVTDEYQLPPSPGNEWPRVATNHNRLLGMYPSATGIKTGYTVPAGLCVVGSAEAEGRRLIAVVLNGGEDFFEDCAALLDYGMVSFCRVVYARAGEELFRIKVGNLPGGEVSVASPADLVRTVRLDRLNAAMSGAMEYRAWADYPVEDGQALGSLTVNPDGTPVVVALEAQEAAPSPGPAGRAWAFIASIFAAAGRILGFLVPGALTMPGGLRWT